MAEKTKESEYVCQDWGDREFEYDGGHSGFTGEIADKEMDAVLDDIMDEALGKK